MRISDWSSDVCSSDLPAVARLDLDGAPRLLLGGRIEPGLLQAEGMHGEDRVITRHVGRPVRKGAFDPVPEHARLAGVEVDEMPGLARQDVPWIVGRSEEHTSEIQSLMHISYSFFCLQ